MSKFDRWLTTEPEPDDPEFIEVDCDQPDPCAACGWVGCHEEECPLDQEDE